MRTYQKPPRQAGATLVELMVALVIGTVIIMALMTVTSRFESGKRQSGSASELSMSAGSVAFDFDRQIRSAGANYLQAYPQALGCTLQASRGGTQLLPAPAAFPAPFAAVPQQVRLIPFLIYPGLGNNGSDIFSVISGTAGSGGMPTQLKPGTSQASMLTMASTVAVSANDVLLMLENNRACLLTQVAPTYAAGTSSQVSLSGDYYAATVNSLAVSDYGLNDVATVVNMGNSANNPPQMTLYGIDANQALQAYDVLNTNGATATLSMLTNVVDMRALYFVDTNGDGIADTWISPTNATYTVAALTANTVAAQQNLSRIRAVRIALILRSDRVEGGANSSPVSAATMTLFPDLASSLQIVHNFSTAETYQRFRLVDFTVPLRNTLLLPGVSTSPALQAQATR